MTEQQSYFFDWKTIEAKVNRDIETFAPFLTISVSGPCPAITPHGVCESTLTFSWTGNITPITRPPEFVPITQCPTCGTQFDPPLLPAHPLRPRSIFLWWRMAQDQEREEIRKCMRDDWKRGARKAEKKGKKRKDPKLKKGNDDRWDFC